MTELHQPTLDEAWKAAWKAAPLPEYPVSGADLSAFNYGRDCAAAAVKALRDIHPIRERRKHERKVKDAIAASAMSAGTAETQSGSGLQPASAVGEAETPKAPKDIGGPSQ